MNEFDHIVRESRGIFNFYGMNHEKPVIYEILYNSDHLLRYLLRNDRIFNENLKKEVPPLSMIQQVFNDVNQQYSQIVAGNQGGFVDRQLANAKVSMDDVFHVIFEKPPDENMSMEKKTKDENT